MKLEIWCKSGWTNNSQNKSSYVKAVLLRIIEWPVMPRVGDYIIVWDGWCSEKVEDVHHSFDDNICCVEIRPDCTGEYAKRVENDK